MPSVGVGTAEEQGISREAHIDGCLGGDVRVDLEGSSFSGGRGRGAEEWVRVGTRWRLLECGELVNELDSSYH